jgi:ABC-type multidrug transport system fused ATPase/permease subunit
VDISQFNINFLRQELGLVSQEPLLFNTSILQNIRYGNLNATDEEIIEASKKACAFDFIQVYQRSLKQK